MCASKAPLHADSAPSDPKNPTFPVRRYQPRHTQWPYTASDFTRQDSSTDTSFYNSPRFVTHIDDNAIARLKQYYSSVLPRRGKILDLCSSWISHFPSELEAAAIAGKNGEEGGLEVIGLGMNARELEANPILKERPLVDLNAQPRVSSEMVGKLDATTCVVSVDYLTDPRAVLSSIRDTTREGGMIHLVISNRCFPTKAVRRWLYVGEEERLLTVGDYLHYSGWKDIEIVEVCDGKKEVPVEGIMGMFGMMGRSDPLWVVRAVKTSEASDR